VLSTHDPATYAKGQILKRVVRAAAALNDLYDDVAIAEATGKGRGTVAGWWEGARMQPETIQILADATGLSREELTQFIYFDGPMPQLPDSGRAGLRAGTPPAHERPGG